MCSLGLLLPGNRGGWTKAVGLDRWSLKPLQVLIAYASNTFLYNKLINTYPPTHIRTYIYPIIPILPINPLFNFRLLKVLQVALKLPISGPRAGFV